jgi:hypothetical protein
VGAIEELFQIRFDTGSSERAIEGVRLRMTALDDELSRLDAAWRNGEVGAERFYGESRRLEAGIQGLIDREGQLTRAYQQNQAAAQANAQAQQRIASALAGNQSAGGAIATAVADQGLGRVAQGMGRVGAASQDMGSKLASANMRMMQLAYFADDLQYGLRGIGNNIPMFAQSVLGLSGQWAGALALLGTAVAVNVNHLEEWKSILDEVQGREGNVLRKLTTWWQGYTGAIEEARAAKAKAAREAQVAAGNAAIAGINPAGGSEIGADFAAAVAAAGGGETVRDAVKRAIVAANPKAYRESDERGRENLKKLVDNIAVGFAEAMKGNPSAIAGFGAVPAIKGVMDSLDSLKEIQEQLHELGKKTELTKGDDAALAGMLGDVRAKEAEAPKDLRGDSVLKKQARAMLDAIEALRRRYGAEVEREVDEFNNATQAAVKEQSDKAIRGVGTAYGEALRDQLVRDKAAGLDQAKQLEYLRRSIEEEVRRLFPKLSPDEFARAVAELFRKTKDDVRDLVAKLEAEGLDAAQAIRRLDMERRQRVQAQQEKLAGDEFAQVAAAQLEMFRRMHNPNMPPPTPDQLRAAGGNMTQYLTALGLTAQQQVAVGRSLNSPTNARRASGILGELMGGGMDERSAFLALPGVLGRIGNAQGQQGMARAGAAINQALNAHFRNQQQALGGMMRAQAQEFNAAANFRNVPAAARGPGGPAHVVAGNTDQLLVQALGVLNKIADNTARGNAPVLRR